MKSVKIPNYRKGYILNFYKIMSFILAQFERYQIILTC